MSFKSVWRIDQFIYICAICQRKVKIESKNALVKSESAYTDGTFYSGLHCQDGWFFIVTNYMTPLGIRGMDIANYRTGINIEISRSTYNNIIKNNE